MVKYAVYMSDTAAAMLVAICVSLNLLSGPNYHIYVYIKALEVTSEEMCISCYLCVSIRFSPPFNVISLKEAYKAIEKWELFQECFLDVRIWLD